LTLTYPSYQYLVEQYEAEIREREQWVEELIVRWGLVMKDDSASASLNR